MSTDDRRGDPDPDDPRTALCDVPDIGVGLMEAAVRAVPREDRDASGLAVLGRTIEREIIPRLLVAQRRWDGATPRAADRTVPDGEAEAFASELIAADDGAARARLARLRDTGVGYEAMLLGLVAPAARRLGFMWERDECSFLEVTLGMVRLQTHLAHIAREIDAGGAAAGARDARVLLTPAPGEQHVLGVLIVQEFFRREGFDVTALTAGDGDEVIAELRRARYAALGISTAQPESFERVRTLVRRVRRIPGNRRLFVLAGGRAVAEHKEAARHLGCDGISIDGRDAIVQLQVRLSRVSESGANRSKASVRGAQIDETGVVLR